MKVVKWHRASGDPRPTAKVCPRCSTEKDLAEFRQCKRSATGVRPECRSCGSEEQRRYHADNRESERQRAKRYSQNNREKQRERLRRWRKDNPERDAKIAAEWRRGNPESVSATSKRSYNKRMCDPSFRIHQAVRGCIWQTIRRGSKATRRTEALLGYDFETLKKHLERQFGHGMSWDNYGRRGWHIDHIIPVSSFKFDTPDDPEFRRAWALSNLRPLWAKDNWQKHAKRTLLI